MSDDVLDADARSLLELGRDHLGPDPETVARLRGRIETAAAVAGTATIAAGIASKARPDEREARARRGDGDDRVDGGGDPRRSPSVTSPRSSHRRASRRRGAWPRQRHAARSSVAPIAESAPDLGHEPTLVSHNTVGASNVAASNVATRFAPEPAPPPREQVPPVVTPMAPKRASLARETELVDLATHAMRANDLVDAASRRFPCMRRRPAVPVSSPKTSTRSRSKRYAARTIRSHDDGSRRSTRAGPTPVSAIA